MTFVMLDNILIRCLSSVFLGGYSFNKFNFFCNKSAENSHVDVMYRHMRIEIAPTICLCVKQDPDGV